MHLLFKSTFCKFHSIFPNDCQDFANLLLEHFNFDHPVMDNYALMH